MLGKGRGSWGGSNGLGLFWDREERHTSSGAGDEDGGVGGGHDGFFLAL